VPSARHINDGDNVRARIVRARVAGAVVPARHRPAGARPAGWPRVRTARADIERGRLLLCAGKPSLRAFERRGPTSSGEAAPEAPWPRRVDRQGGPNLAGFSLRSAPVLEPRPAPGKIVEPERSGSLD
jgi:hypothetical protein